METLSPQPASLRHNNTKAGRAGSTIRQRKGGGEPNTKGAGPSKWKRLQCSPSASPPHRFDDDPIRSFPCPPRRHPRRRKKEDGRTLLDILLGEAFLKAGSSSTSTHNDHAQPKSALVPPAAERTEAQKNQQPPHHKKE
ncbi:hypothetical protein QOT17_016367 [Balamuthia mandrillaris]